MTLTITPLNSVQKIPEFGINGSSAILGSEVVYTCPVGKKAKGSVTCTLNSFGTANDVRFRAAGSKIINYTVAAQLIGSTLTGIFTLAAGETLIASANLGTTSGMDWAVSIQETPA